MAAHSSVTPAVGSGRTHRRTSLARTRPGVHAAAAVPTLAVHPFAADARASCALVGGADGSFPDPSEKKVWASGVHTHGAIAPGVDSDRFCGLVMMLRLRVRVACVGRARQREGTKASCTSEARPFRCCIPALTLGAHQERCVCCVRPHDPCLLPPPFLHTCDEAVVALGRHSRFFDCWGGFPRTSSYPTNFSTLES